MQSPLALCNLRVIELGQLIAGPFAAKTLADFGADVIKIEPPTQATLCANGAYSMTAHRCGGKSNRVTNVRLL